MNFSEFFSLIKPRISWWGEAGYWWCSGCGRIMDKPEKDLHWPDNCSLAKLKFIRRVRDLVITANPRAYASYAKTKIYALKKAENNNDSVPLTWYRNQIRRSAKLSIDLNLQTCNVSSVHRILQDKSSSDSLELRR